MSKQKKTPQQRKEIRKQGFQQFVKGTKQIYSSAPGLIGGIAKTALGNPVTQVGGAIDVVKNVGKNVAGSWNRKIGLAKMIFNDLEWYNKYPALISEMIGPNFNTRVGISEPLLDLNSEAAHDYSAACAGAIYVSLMNGDDTNGAVSAAMLKLFTAIRQANSGSINYSPVAINEYIYNWRVVITMYAMACRALRELNRASLLHKGVPEAMFAAMNLDYATFSQNAADLRNYLTTVAVQLKSLAVMKLPIFERTEWMFRGCFWDSDDRKHQTYFFVPTQLKPFNHSSGLLTNACFTATRVNATTTGCTYSTFVNGLKAAVDALISVDLFSVMSGDIVKAYGLDGIYRLPEIPSINDEPIQGYSEEVLTQIQNAFAPISSVDPTLNHNIVRNNNTDVALGESISMPTSGLAVGLGSTYLATTFVNFYKDDISNLDVVGATRLITLGTGNGATFTPSTWGTEIYCGFEVFGYDYGSGNTGYHKLQFTPIPTLCELSVTSSANIEMYSAREGYWSQFDYAPRVNANVYYYPQSSATGSNAVGFTLFDLNNYAKIESINQLRAIHDIAVQSLYFTELKVKASNNVVDY